MATALPRPVQLKLDQTLAQWRHWHCDIALQRKPTMVRTLHGGISNYSVLVEAAQRFVVRIDGVNPIALGLNRQAEWHAMNSAQDAGLAPAPCYFNPELGSLVSEYLEFDPDFEDTPESIAQLLRNIHALPPSHHRLDFNERILRYERKYRPGWDNERARLDSWREAVLSSLERLREIPRAVVLCHNDLLRANRIASGGRLYAIDWEYCAMGDPLYDLAVVICGDELDSPDSGMLVTEYLGRPPDELETERLRQHCRIYRYLELAWYFTLEKPGIDGNSLEIKLQAMEAAFERGP